MRLPESCRIAVRCAARDRAKCALNPRNPAANHASRCSGGDCRHGRPGTRRKKPTVAIADIHNFRQAAPDLATSGQPNEDQLAAIAAAGYDLLVNLALHDDPRYSLRDEASSVRALRMEYVHIPVQFAAPASSDLVLFCDAMDRARGRRVWVHCAANMRVTAFLGLYWRLREGWPEAKAFALMRDGSCTYSEDGAILDVLRSRR